MAQNKPIEETVFLLRGSVPDLDDQYIYLSYSGSFDRYVTDSVKVNDGVFAFNGQIKEPTMAFLSLKKVTDNQSAFFLEPNKKLEIRINGTDFRDFDFYGSNTQEEYQAYDAAGKTLKTYEEHRDHALNYISKHPDSYVSVMKLHSHFSRLPIEKVTALYEAMPPRIANSVVGENVKQKIAKVLENQPGTTAKDFIRTTSGGDTLSLTAYRGKYVLLDFWASWCVPCREEGPALKELFQRYNKKGLEIIGISSDTNIGAWQRAIREDKTELWPHILSGNVENPDWETDLTEWISKNYSVSVLPTKFLIGPDGSILKVYRGTDNTLEQFKQDLTGILP